MRAKSSSVVGGEGSEVEVEAMTLGEAEDDFVE